MERRTCKHCGKEYAVVPDDAVVAHNVASPWLDLVCKRCTCFLRRYHTWTITDGGARICGYCFLRRLPMDDLVRHYLARKRREKTDHGPETS